MSYDDKPTRYSFGNFDFGDADQTFSIIPPKGKSGYLHDYGVFGVTEVFNGGTVTPKISVGTTSDADAYGDELDLNALADNHAMSVRTTYSEPSTSFATYMINRHLPKDTELYVHIVAATGSPTGQAIPFVDIIWDR
jgi:hypothetical protein